jgi:hypothetical protein
VNLKRLALAACLALPAAPVLASPLLVEPAPGLAALPDVSLEQARVRDALNALDLDLAGQRLAIGRRGRQDLVFQTAVPLDEVVGALKAAYLGKRILTHNLRVAGWAFIDARQAWTFTLEDAGTLDSWVAEVAPGSGGTRVTLAGVTQRWHAPASNLPHIPRRGDPSPAARAHVTLTGAARR